jgi:hypothetical protein
MSKENIKIRVFRDNPFCWQNKGVLRLIQKKYKGQKLTSRVAVYTVLTQIASDSSSEDYETWGIKIMEMAGVGYTTLRTIFNEFGDMKILKREQERTKKGTYGKLEVTLLEPITTASQSKPNGKASNEADNKDRDGDLQSIESSSETKKENIGNSKKVASGLTELSSFGKRKPKASSFSEQKSIKENKKQERIEKYKEAVELGIYFEKFLGMPMPDKIIYVSTKREDAKEVDMNIQSGKRMIKKYGKEKMELLVKLFFELKKEVPVDEKKYIIVVGNLFEFEQKLSKVFSFIENQGVDPHTGQRFKNAKPNTTFEEMARGKVVRKDKW